MREIQLSQKELLYSVVRMGAKDFIRVTDSSFSVNKKQFILDSILAQSSLVEKGYAEFDADDNFVLSNEIKNAIDVCANCETCIIVEEKRKDKSPIRKLYYDKDSLIIELQQLNENIILIPIDTRKALIDQILRGIKWEAPVPQFTSTISLHNEILWKAKDCFSSTDKDNGVQILVESGCPNNLANAIAEGLSGDAASFAIVALSFDNDNAALRSVIFTDTKSGIIQLCSDSTKDEFTRFKMITSGEAHKEIEGVLS